MTIYSLHIFNKKCECIFFKDFVRSPVASSDGATGDSAIASGVDGDSETAKLVFGVVFSLRNMCQKLAAGKNSKDGFVAYKTNTYKLHYFESAAGLKMVLITDPNADAMLDTLRDIYAQIYVEYVVKNPLAKPNTPLTNPLFRSNLDKFIRNHSNFE